MHKRATIHLLEKPWHRATTVLVCAFGIFLWILLAVCSTAH